MFMCFLKRSAVINTKYNPFLTLKSHLPATSGIFSCACEQTLKSKNLQLLVQLPDFGFVLRDLQREVIPLRRDLRRVPRRVGGVGARRRVRQRHLDDVVGERVPVVDQLLDVVHQDDVEVVALHRDA